MRGGSVGSGERVEGGGELELVFVFQRLACKHLAHLETLQVEKRKSVSEKEIRKGKSCGCRKSYIDTS